MEKFRSQSEALQHITFGIERGQYENCGNLKVTDTLNMMTGRMFLPHCDAHSLGEKEQNFSRDRTSYCPENCHFFVSKEEAEKDKRTLERKEAIAIVTTKTRRNLVRFLSAPFTYFAKLSAPVQVLLIAMVIIWLFPKFKDSLLEVLSAIKK
jgi:hypothetical protein